MGRFTNSTHFSINTHLVFILSRFRKGLMPFLFSPFFGHFSGNPRPLLALPIFRPMTNITKSTHFSINTHPVFILSHFREDPTPFLFSSFFGHFSGNPRPLLVLRIFRVTP